MNVHKTLLCGMTAMLVASGTQFARSEGEPVAPATTPEWGRTSVGVYAGDSDAVYMLDGLVPLWSEDNSVVFFNPHASFLGGDEQELNLGVVARQLCEDTPMIVGVNAYYDALRTENDNTFNQASIGIELLSRWVDLSANYYHPLTDAKTADVSEEVVSFVSGGRDVTRVTRYETMEEALQGYDVEAGVWVPWLSDHVPTALFVGYTDLDSDELDEGVDGASVRLEMRPHPNITLDAEWFENGDAEDTDYFVGARVNLPLDFWNGWRLDGPAGQRVRIPSFSSRLNDPVRRTFSVRTLESRPMVVSQQQIDGDRPSPKVTCSEQVTLDKDGNVVIVTVCEK